MAFPTIGYRWRTSTTGGYPPPSLSDPGPAEFCFTEAKPDLILFTDSFPLVNLAAKEAAARLGLPYLVLVHCVQPAWAKQYAPFLPHLPAANSSNWPSPA